MHAQVNHSRFRTGFVACLPGGPGDGTEPEVVERPRQAGRLSRALGALLLLGMALPSVAADPAGWYFGAGAGQTRAKISGSAITTDLPASRFDTSAFGAVDRGLGYKPVAGYRFNRHFAIEAGYVDLGEFAFTAITKLAGSLEGELEFSGWNLDLVGMIPVTERASVLGRIGGHRGKSRVSLAGADAVGVLDSRVSRTDTNYKLGVGVHYQMTPALALRLEAERYRMDDARGNTGDLDLFSAGLVYYFGRRAAVAAPRMSTPAAPPVAEGTLVVVPLPAQTQEYCSLLDIQFEIDADEIQRAEQDKLAAVATFLDRYPDTGAVIEGHTDNVGSAARNMQRSQRRAESVVDHLVRSHGIERLRLTAVGRGATRPIADNRTEEGKRANRRIGTIIGCATDMDGLEPVAARMTLAVQIRFDADSAVGPEFHDQLGEVAELLNANPRLSATLEGHTDNARPEIAQRIAQQRAQSVLNYLVTRFGVDRSRLTALGFGEARRFAYNTSAEGRQVNRRVNITLDDPY